MKTASLNSFYAALNIEQARKLNLRLCLRAIHFIHIKFVQLTVFRQFNVQFSLGLLSLVQFCSSTRVSGTELLNIQCWMHISVSDTNIDTIVTVKRLAVTFNSLVTFRRDTQMMAEQVI